MHSEKRTKLFRIEYSVLLPERFAFLHCPFGPHSMCELLQNAIRKQSPCLKM